MREETAACVVLASPGYPGTPRTGEPIRGLDRAAALPGVEIFHAGTATAGGELVSAGGRVLDVCALGPDLATALDRAYAAVEAIDWPGKIVPARHRPPGVASRETFERFVIPFPSWYLSCISPAVVPVVT